MVVFFFFYIGMASGSEVLLGLLPRVTTRIERTCQNKIVLNVLIDGTKQCLEGNWNYYRLAVSGLDLGIIFQLHNEDV